MMFENGIIDFDITIYFNDSTNFSINSSALVSIGDIVSQITDDDPISKSNNFNIELLARLLPESAQFSPQNIKYIDCLGKWRCEGVTFKDDKCIFTCSGFLQNLKEKTYEPGLPADGYRYIYDSLSTMQPGINDVLNNDSYNLLTAGYNNLARLCDQQKISDFVLQPTGNVTHKNGSTTYHTYTNFQFKNFDFTLNNCPFALTKPIKSFRWQDRWITLTLDYQNYLSSCGCTINYSDQENTINYCDVGLQWIERNVAYLDITTSLAVGKDGPLLAGNFDSVQFSTIAAAMGATNDQIIFAKDHNYTLADLSAGFEPTNEYFKGSTGTLKMMFQPSPVLYSNFAHSIIEIGLYNYSIKTSTYTKEKLAQALKMNNLLLSESFDSVKIQDKAEIFDNNDGFVLDCNNINNLQETNDFFNIYDGVLINIQYLRCLDAAGGNFNFLPKNCYWPEKIETTLLNGVLPARNFWTLENSQYVVRTMTNYLNLRLGALAGYNTASYIDQYNDERMRFIPAPVQLTDDDNNIYICNNIQTIQSTDNDAGMLFNKNNDLADFTHPDEGLLITYNQKPQVNAFSNDFIDVTGIEGIKKVYDLGPHQIFQCETNLDCVELLAGQRATLQNIRDFGDENAVYDILIINRQIHLLSGSCTVQFIILDSDYTGKIGFNEKSKWQQYYNHWYLRNYENTDVESPADLLNTTQKIHVMCKNFNTGWQKEFIVADSFSQDNIFTYSCAMPYEVAEFLYGENTNDSVSLRYDVGAGMKVSLNSVALPDLSNKIVVLKYGKTTPNNLQNYGDMGSGTWIWNGSRIDSQWQKKPYDIISNLTSTPNKLQLIIMNSAGTIWTGTGTSWDSSNSRFVVSSPYSTVITNAYVKLSGNAVQIDMVVRSTYRNNFPTSHSWANALWNADFTLKEDCKVLVKRVE